MSDRL